MQKLIDLVDLLYEHNAYHVKRGFRINESSPLIASNHLLEEAVELQAEVIEADREAIIEESGDLLALFCHLIKQTDITLEEVVDSAVNKLNKAYTTNPAEVTAATPGVTRRSRS